jgi:hypothetical protein
MTNVENMHITEQLLHGTIRIESSNTTETWTGTGFFFNFLNESQQTVPLIITNRHVVEGSKEIKLYFKKVKDNLPDYSEAFVVTIPNGPSTVILHPDKNVDLAAIPTAPIYSELDKRQIGVYYIAADENSIPTDNDIKEELKAIEDIWMIGYPNGLWDSKNNMPIVRKGTTATTPFLDYNGKKEFLIDIAAFGGSSGSPIIYYRDIYMDKNYQAKIGPKLYLLGVLYAGPLYRVDGKIIKSTSFENKPNELNIETSIPMNLGFVIKSREILKFKDILIPKN